VTFEFYLERLSTTTYFLSKTQNFSFLKLAAVKQNEVEKIVPFDTGPERQRGSALRIAFFDVLASTRTAFQAFSSMSQ